MDTTHTNDHTEEPEDHNNGDTTAEASTTEAPTTEDRSEDIASDDSAEKSSPRRKPRRKRPDGRWTNPASKLQGERFRRKLGGLQVVKAIRRLCPGHAGQPCKIDVAKLSDYETQARRPGLLHIEAFCRFYQKSPEDLGLITWRNDPATPPGLTADAISDAPPPEEPDDTNGDSEAEDPTASQLVVIWMHDRPRHEVTATASAILRLISQSQSRDPDGDEPTA